MLLAKPYLCVIIDDDQDLCDLIKESLELKYNGLIKPIAYYNPVEAYEYIQANDVMMVICDLSMPELHGQSLLRMVRDLKKGIKTVSMTGGVSLTGSITRFRGGDVALMIKPFEEEELFRIVDNVLESLELWSHCIKKVVGK